MICYHAITAEIGFYAVFALLGWVLMARLPAEAGSTLIWLGLFCALAAFVYMLFLFVVAIATTGGYAHGEGSCGQARVAFLGFRSLLLIAGFYALVLLRSFFAAKGTR